jgi:hypothetical protein
VSIPKPKKLKQARQLLKCIEDDESAFRTRIAGLSTEEQARAVEWFCRIRDRHRARVQQLESELEEGSLAKQCAVKDAGPQRV